MKSEKRKDLFGRKPLRHHSLSLCAVLVMATLGLGVCGAAGAQGGVAEPMEALRLAYHAQAELHSHDDEGLVRSVLLATESLRRAPTIEAIDTLQAGLDLLPRRVYQWPEGTRLSIVSDDDRWIVLRMDDEYELWELPSPANSLSVPRQVATLSLDSETEGLTFSHDGDWLLSWTPEQLQIWRAKDGQSVAAWTPDSSLVGVEPRAEGRRLFLIGETRIRVLDASDLPKLHELGLIPRESASLAYALSPDGRFVALVSAEGTQVEVWQADDVQLAHVIALSREPERLLFHPEGTHLVGSDGAAVHIWNVETGLEVATARTGRSWPGIAFSSTGKWLITPGVAESQQVNVFPFPPESDQLTAGESVLRTWNGDSVGVALTFSPDDRWLMRFEDCTQKRCSPWRYVTVWDMARSNPDDRELNLTLAGRINDASFSPDGRWLHTVRTPGVDISQIWRLPDGVEAVRLPGYRTRFSPGGRWLLGYHGDGGPLQLWTADPGRHWNSMRHDSTYYTGYGAGPLEFSPDGRWLATGGVDNLVRVWDPTSGAQHAALEHDEIYYLDLRGGVVALAFSPDGQMLASLNDGGDLRLWEMAVVTDPAITDALPLRQFRTPPWSSIAFSPDGNWLVADQGVWNTATGEQRYGSELFGGYALSLDGRLIASRQDSAITLRDFASGEPIHEFEHQDGLGNLVFGPQGRWLVSVGEETIHIWDTLSGQLAHLINLGGRSQGYAVGPKSRWIAVGTTSSPPVVWDIESGEVVSHLAPTATAARPLSFSPDGQSLVVRDLQNDILIFDVGTGAAIASLPRTVRINGVIWSADGEQIVTTDAQGRVRFWLWRPEDLVAAACQHLPRNFTVREWQRYFGEEPYRPTCDELPAATSVSILTFSVHVDDVNTGKQLAFQWKTTGATRAEIWSGTSQRSPKRWDVPPSGTFSVELQETFYANPSMTLIAYDDKGEQVRRSLQADWTCHHEYFFSPAPKACPLHAAVLSAAAEQVFEHGRMIRLQRIYGHENVIFVLHDDGRLERFDDTWTPGEPEGDPAVAPPKGFHQPVRGLGKLWRENEAVREQLGWALAPEEGFEGAWQEQMRESVPSMAYLRIKGGEIVKVWDWNARWGGGWSETRQ
jgi:WD40 repeat protein